MPERTECDNCGRRLEGNGKVSVYCETCDACLCEECADEGQCPICDGEVE